MDQVQCLCDLWIPIKPEGKIIGHLYDQPCSKYTLLLALLVSLALEASVMLCA